MGRWSGLASAIVLVMLGTGCGATVTYTQTGAPPGRMTPRPASAVEVFMGSRPERPFKEVGLIESQQSSAYSTAGQGEIIAALREEAGQRGCHGLVMLGSADSVVGGGSTANGSGSSTVSTLKGYRASCIVFTGAPPQADQGASSQPASTAQAASPSARSCVPNATQACLGPGACKGAQSCTADGSSWTACDCGTATSGTGAPENDATDAQRKTDSPEPANRADGRRLRTGR